MSEASHRVIQVKRHRETRRLDDPPTEVFQTEMIERSIAHERHSNKPTPGRRRTSGVPVRKREEISE